MRLRNRNYLIAKMAERHYTIRVLAAAAHCHPSTIGHLASGKRDTCSPRMSVSIEKALHCTPGELFEARAVKARSRSAA